MPIPVLSDKPWLITDPLIATAMAKSRQASSARTFIHLPDPVWLRATGALRAWEHACAHDAGVAKARRVLGNPNASLDEAFIALGDAVARHVVLDQNDRYAAAMDLRVDLSTASFLLAFWWRNGALYEPTLPLGNLLGGSDIAADLPAQLLTLPVPALCIVPPAQHRHDCGDASAVLLYEHRPEQGSSSRRTIAMLAMQVVDGYRQFDGVQILIEHEHEALLPQVERALAQRRPMAGVVDPAKAARVREASAESWKIRLDYVLKTLLYLRAEGAQTRHVQPYSAAPKAFPGLGRRKRDEKLTQIDQLYDRYIVGPESLTLRGPDGESEPLSHGAEIPPHWRRGHFRSQPYGPHSSLRKVIFVAPIIVRADKLAAAG